MESEITLPFGTHGAGNCTREIDKGVLAAVIVLLLISAGALFGGSSIRSFLSFSSVLVVFGGILSAALINFSVDDLLHAWNECKTVIFSRNQYPLERISYMVALSHLVRHEGILSLEKEAESQGDHFLRLGFEMAVDGQAPDDIRTVLENEICVAGEKQSKAIAVFQGMATYAPAMGLIGTIIGLIQMLGVLNDPSAIGPSMSMALLTTLYGSVLANLVLLPIAGKLRIRSEEEKLVKRLTIEGILSLTKRDSPVIVEQRLKSYFAAI